MFTETRNTARSGNIREQRLFTAGFARLRDIFPKGWRITATYPNRTHDETFDATVNLRAPDGKAVHVFVAVKGQLWPRDVLHLVERLQRMPSRDWLVISSFVGATARAMLTERGVGYVDLTGNCYLSISTPAILIARDGARSDPDPPARSVSTLRSPKAALLVRDLIERRAPGTVRQIAERTGTSPAQTSRLLAFLHEQALVTRDSNGVLASVDWPALLRRWAIDTRRTKPLSYLEPRGLEHLVTKLEACEIRYAITGSMVASLVVATAPTRLAKIYVHDANAAAHALGLRPADAGANVQLFVVDDESPLRPGARPTWAPTPTRLRYASAVQVAGDLLVGPGREPAEGEAMIEWMQEHEEAWRV